MTRWLVTGARGMLGQDMLAALRPRRETVLGLGRGELDVTDEAAVRAVVSDYRPDLVVNCAAWTAVDFAEEHEAAALAVNGTGAEYLAAICGEVRARLVHVSTDYVFGGDASRPYAEDDEPAPGTAYSRTKLAGERAVLSLLPGSAIVVRTAWLYGGAGPSFVHTMARLASLHEQVDVVADQHGQPSWTADVAGQIIALALSGHRGIFHATSAGQTTWFGLAREVFALAGSDPALVRATSSEAYPRPAPRPGYSVLANLRQDRAGIEPIGDWRLALHEAWPSLR